MIKLALYAYGFYWLLGKAGYGISKTAPVQGLDHQHLEHPMGEVNCSLCAQRGTN